MKKSLSLLFFVIAVFWGQSGAQSVDFLDIPYDSMSGINANLLSLDIFSPSPTAGPYPVIIYIHGGTWQGGDKSQVGFKKDFFIENGYVFVSVNYRLSPQCPPCDTVSQDAIRFPDHPRDVSASIAWVVNNISQYHGNPSRIGLLGHSAGAHLAALVATDETYLSAFGLNLSAIQCVVPLDGAVYDLPKQITTGAASYQLALKNAFGTDPVAWINASPVSHILPENQIPFFFLVHQNVIRRIEQNYILRDSLLKYENPVETMGIDLTHGEINVLLGITKVEQFELLESVTNTPSSPNAYQLSRQLTDSVLSVFDRHLGNATSILHTPVTKNIYLNSYLNKFDLMGRRGNVINHFLGDLKKSKVLFPAQ